MLIFVLLISFLIVFFLTPDPPPVPLSTASDFLPRFLQLRVPRLKGLLDLIMCPLRVELTGHSPQHRPLSAGLDLGAFQRTIAAPALVAASKSALATPAGLSL